MDNLIIAVSIPENIAMLINPVGYWRYDKDTLEYTAFSGKNVESAVLGRYTKTTLDTIDHRLEPALRGLVDYYSMLIGGQRYVAPLLRENVSCWFGATVLDLVQFKFKARYFIKQLVEISTNTKCPSRADLTVVEFARRDGPDVAYTCGVCREEMFTTKVSRARLYPKWSELETLWPGVQSLVKAAENVGLEPSEIANLVLQSVENNATTLATPVLPDQLTQTV